MYRAVNRDAELSRLKASSLAIVRKRDGEIPRFLFRGFNKHSGEHWTQNTAISIQPHVINDMPMYSSRGRGWIGSAMTALFGMHYKFQTWKHVEMHQYPYEWLRDAICEHLRGEKRRRLRVTPFSSWTADLITAMKFAVRGPSPQIGILDTRKRNDYNVIMHVPALCEAGLSDYNFPEEYLVYGPVHGACYTCFTPRWPMISFDLWAMMSTNTTVACVRKARSRVAHHKFYRVGDAWFEKLWGVCTDSAVYLTIIAAEWGRTKSQADRELAFELGIWPGTPIQTSSEEIQEVVFELSDVIERAASDPNLVLPLVNPHTYVPYKNVELMVKLLMQIEQEITALRSRATT